MLGDNLDNSYSPYLDDLPEDLISSDYEVARRSPSNNNNNFLRFGRSGSSYEYDSDYPEDFARPTRSGKIDKNDHFIRFGRSKQDFLRFGRDSHRQRQRNNGQSSNYLRFGRNSNSLEHLQRSKRETYDDLEPSSTAQSKRQQGSSNFLRFGRDRPFLRFGRDPNADFLQLHHQSPLIQLLNELLIENLKKEAAGTKINRTV